MGLSQFQSHRQHGRAIECHPRCAVSLLQKPTGRQRLRAIKYSDVVHPQESAAEQVVALRILAIHPPGEIQVELLEHSGEKMRIALAALSGDLVNTPRSPRMQRWVYVGERKLIRGNLTVRMHVPFTQQSNDLVFCELRIDRRHWNHVTGKVPRRVPWVLPLVGDRDNVAVIEMRPLAVASVLTAFGRRRLSWIAIEPMFNTEMNELL